MVEGWRSSGKWQVIGQAELLPVLLAAVVWADILRNRYVVFWLDQDAARQGLTKGYSPSEHSAVLIDLASQHLSALQVFPWFARVPSASNPADAPSRLDLPAVWKSFPGALRRQVPAEAWVL